MKSEQLRWGFFGAGKCTHDFVVALKTLPSDQHKAVAISSRDETKAAEFAQKLGLERAYGTYLELAKAHDIDIIYIGTVNSEHFLQAKLALEHGKHVLCEKPVCINLKQAKGLVEIAKNRKLFFMEGFWTFFFPATIRLFEEIRNNSIGDVTQMIVAVGSKFFHLDRFCRNDIGGGTLINHGVYGLMFATQIFGKPVGIKASGIVANGVDQSVSVILEYGDAGRIATVMCSSKVDMPGEITVIGTMGTLKLRFPFWAPTTLETPNGSVHFDLPELPLPGIKFNNLNSIGFIYEIEAVRKCILSGEQESSSVPWKSSLTVLEIADEIRKQIGVTYQPDDVEQHLNGSSSN